jgi:Ras-related protein Rab-22
MYYRNAAAAIVCFDITNEDSFTKMKDWVEELKQNVAPEQLVLAIACNKADLESLRVISRSRAEQFAQRVNAILYETSAKENFGVEEIFRKITEDVVARMVAAKGVGGDSATAPSSVSSGGQKLGATTTASKESSGCC